MHRDEIRFRHDTRGMFATAAACRDAGHMGTVRANSGVRISRVIGERRVRVLLLERSIDGRAVVHNAVAEGLRGVRSLAASLVPEGDDTRAAITMAKVGVGE